MLVRVPFLWRVGGFAVSNRPDIEELLRLAEKATKGSWPWKMFSNAPIWIRTVGGHEVGPLSDTDRALLHIARDAVPALAKYALELERERDAAMASAEELRPYARALGRVEGLLGIAGRPKEKTLGETDGVKCEACSGRGAVMREKEAGRG